MILGMNHFTAIAKDPVATLDFYERIIGLKVGPRPDLGFPGAWLYASDTAVLHLYFERPDIDQAQLETRHLEPEILLPVYVGER